MSQPPDREGKSDSNGEVFTAILTDSQDSLEQPKGEIKDLFKRKYGKGAKGGGSKTSIGSTH